MESQFEGPSICVTKCQRGREEEWGVSKGHINPCQCRPNYLSPCANKRSPEQPIRGGRGWCVRSVRAASDAAAWPPSLFLLSLLLGPPPHYSSDAATGPWWLYIELQMTVEEWVGCWRGPRSSFHSPVTFSPQLSLPFIALICPLLIKPAEEDLSGICKYALVSLCFVFVCL